jgi:dTDP-4-dehydrorhamnose 3,5-epimerase
MNMNELRVKGCFTIDLDTREDDRGLFARAWCRQTLERHGLTGNFVQCNISVSKKRGTLRGLHYQVSPYQEVKLFRCTRGSLFDVILDLRQDSPTFKQCVGTYLRQGEYRLLYVAEGVAHGFQTLEDDTEVMYHVSQPYMRDSDTGVRWNDRAFGIRWPLTEAVILSEKDQNWPDYTSQGLQR